MVVTRGLEYQPEGQVRGQLALPLFRRCINHVMRRRTGVNAINMTGYF